MLDLRCRAMAPSSMRSAVITSFCRQPCNQSAKI
jgi:hypothetical protein